MRPLAQQAQTGFTLLEVLIALALMAVLSTLSWRALDSTARSSERLAANTDDTMALVRVLGQVESDLSHHVDTGTQPPAPASDMRSPLAAVLPAGIDWNAPQLTVLRTTHQGAWQEVIWTLNGDTLLRAAGAPSLNLPLPAAEHPDAMLTGVQRFVVRAWLPGQGWTESVSGTPPLRATGLEIAIARRHEGRDETYRKVVLLP